MTNPLPSSHQNETAPRFTAQGGFLTDGGVCAEGGEQGGEDGDHNLTDALQGFLCGFFHWTHPPTPLIATLALWRGAGGEAGGECLLRGIWFLDD